MATTAEKRFVRDTDTLGWTVTGDYVNATTPVEAVCPAGHETTLTPKTGNYVCHDCNPKGGSRSFYF